MWACLQQIEYLMMNCPKFFLVFCHFLPRAADQREGGGRMVYTSLRVTNGG
jgi:hypothetical protein